MKTTVEQIKILVPQSVRKGKVGDFETYCVSYSELTDLFGENLLEVRDNDYQGDTRIILRGPDGRIGWLQFGWGSCSGCDALQACDSFEALAELFDRLRDGIKWGTAAELLEFFNTHDWEGDYSWHAEEQTEFVTKAKELLSKLA
jgi:hypothetical protein